MCRVDLLVEGDLSESGKMGQDRLKSVSLQISLTDVFRSTISANQLTSRQILPRAVKIEAFHSASKTTSAAATCVQLDPKCDDGTAQIRPPHHTGLRIAMY